MCPADRGSNPRQVISKSIKIELDVCLLSSQHYKVGDQDMRSNLGKDIGPSPSHRCHSYWKVNLRLFLDYGRSIYIYIYIYIYHQVVLQGRISLTILSLSAIKKLKPYNRTIGIIVSVHQMSQETGVQSQVESYQRLKKWYLMRPCINTYKIRIKDMRINPGKRVAPSPTPWCSSAFPDTSM